LEGETDHYLKSKSWWLGFGLMILGELGNFAAYGFAPAVLVAPLGTVALISNIVIAPIYLGEKIRTQDITGIFFSIIGTVIILAVSTSTTEPTRSIDDILSALAQPLFIVYFATSCAILAILFRYSNSKYGKQFILIDLLIASIIGIYLANLGGYTVLSIKALSSLLKMNLYRMLTHSITYFILFVLILTGVVIQ
jgi:magnesium transporter